ncbi:hypothetical protein CCHR01_09816 [Colletotrichum chrysophilum]|uniref:Uncharacterized protein n=1 Tax=Colletotrichum chrysophilum TaxID=1836956 RepID=A0AAD9AIX8_9PEZI|nr:hypothetical protein CCHR01_09816 [Colletotrichum chrysophilum]
MGRGDQTIPSKHASHILPGLRIPPSLASITCSGPSLTVAADTAHTVWIGH